MRASRPRCASALGTAPCLRHPRGSPEHEPLPHGRTRDRRPAFGQIRFHVPHQRAADALSLDVWPNCNHDDAPRAIGGGDRLLVHDAVARRGNYAGMPLALPECEVLGHELMHQVDAICRE